MRKRSRALEPTADGKPKPPAVPDHAQVDQPDGEGIEWWTRLKNALGTSSSAFVNASLYQIEATARLPEGGISPVAVNGALALLEAIAPRDEVEATVAVQMACTHMAAMAVLGRLDCASGNESHIATFGNTAARLLRAYALEMETLRRLRNGGSQVVRVEHVHVNEGGKAIIGNVISGAISRPDPVG